MSRVAIHVSKVNRFWLILFGLLVSASVYGQKSRQQLEQEKRENLARIAEAERILTETAKEQEATLGQLQAIQNQIRARSALINSLESEINLLGDEIGDLTIIISALESDLENLKEEYAAMIYSAYKANEGYSILMFLFSSSDFNELFMRLQYLDQYTEARRKTAEQIEKVTAELLSQKTEIQSRRDEQEEVLDLQIEENRKLLGLKSQQDLLVDQLNQKQEELKAELEERKKSMAELDKLIAEMIEREARSTNVDAVADNASFEEMQTRLSWPVNSGFIASQFGRQPHPVLDNIYVENSGVGIQTNKNETVRAVSAGTVTMVADSPGMQRVVMIRHGQYLTVYARLAEVSVSRGDIVKHLDPIGTVYTDPDGLTQLEFQVWKGSIKLNPEDWLVEK